MIRGHVRVNACSFCLSYLIYTAFVSPLKLNDVLGGEGNTTLVCTFERHGAKQVLLGLDLRKTDVLAVYQSDFLCSAFKFQIHFMNEHKR